jgi:S1-C subfamily serine protease
MSRNLYLFGQPNSLRQSIKTMDGSARINWNWNSEANKYLVSNEPAFNMSIPIVTDPYFSIRYADSGLRNQNIIWNDHLTIKKNGNIGISKINPEYKLDINGNLSCTDINIKNDNNLNSLKNFSTTVTNIQNTVTKHDSSLSTIQSNLNTLGFRITNVEDLHNSYIFDRIRKACSQICFIINGSSYVGSGWYYADTSAQLVKGYFITAAHCVMEVINNIYYKATSIYVENPITNSWISVDPSNVYIDGIGDIAVLKTNINFTSQPSYCLKLTNSEPRLGDTCYVVGNPGGFDEDSVSIGCIRDAKYTEPNGFQVPESIFVNCPGIGGNSGGPIINVSGDVIGIYTFGNSSNESFGGGSNYSTISKSFSILLNEVDNKQKRYLGLDWEVPSPFNIRNFYVNKNSFPTHGVYIWSVANLSPFKNILNSGDLLLDCSINTTNEYFKFGRNSQDGEKGPGVLIYYYTDISLTITYIKSGTTSISTTSLVLDKTYNNVSNINDSPLNTALRQQINRFPTINMSKSDISSVLRKNLADE